MAKILNNKPNRVTQSALYALEVQFSEYINGQRKKFDLKPFGVHGDLRELKGTDLQRRVWLELLKIPYGTVLTYSELAQKAGNPKAVRAVASAVASNPLYIIIPCHRVVPKVHFRKNISIPKNLQSKALEAKNVGNYALGINMKLALLKLEGVI